MTHGKVFYHDPAIDSLDQLVKEALKNFPSESVFYFRSLSSLAKVHNSTLYGLLERCHFTVKKIEKNLRETKIYTVPKLVQLNAPKPKKINTKKLEIDM